MSFFLFAGAVFYLANLLANLAITTGTDPSRPTYVAIKGIVFDVSKNSAYRPDGPYHGMFLSVCLSVSFELVYIY